MYGASHVFSRPPLEEWKRRQEESQRLRRLARARAALIQRLQYIRKVRCGALHTRSKCRHQAAHDHHPPSFLHHQDLEHPITAALPLDVRRGVEARVQRDFALATAVGEGSAKALDAKALDRCRASLDDFLRRVLRDVPRAVPESAEPAASPLMADWRASRPWPDGLAAACQQV